jgi:glycine oxidase
MRILIVGAGIAGLGIGWRLAQAGAEVTILERGLAGREATWASAGMLAPGAELGSEGGPLVRFALDSRQAWTGFARDLQAASSRDIGFRQDGSLIIAENETRARALEDRAAKLKAAGVDATWLEPTELAAREPLLAPTLRGALHVGGDAQVDNRALAAAVCIALGRSRGRLREYCEVRSLIIDKDRVRGADAQDGPIESDAVILASGAWLNKIGGVSADDLPPVMPVKGQMIALERPSETKLPKALIWDDNVYLVPRRERLFIGATVEDAGFDTSVTLEARDRLLAAAARLVPSASSWRLAEIWAGLRPRTPDGAPVLGQTEISGLYVASGQFRNGILFAPLVADAMHRIVMGQPSAWAVAPFDPKRFRTS